MKVKYAYGVVPEISSIEQGTEFGDKIKIIDKQGITGIVLADLGAEAAGELVSEHFDEFYNSEKDIFDLEGALMFVAVKDKRYLAGHIGDGMIVRLNGSCTVLSKPENDLQIYKGDLQEPFGFMLMSDGACQSLYNESTGDLSSACGTFSEWLKEYDEETVNAALVENINKYFIKETKGDISIAVMVSNDNGTELPETAKRFSKNKDLKYIIIALIVVSVMIISRFVQPGVMEPEQEGKADANPPKPPAAYSADYEPSVTFSVENPESYDAGEYKAGVDIPAGEYFFWTGEMLKAGSIVVNDDNCLSGELYCMTIQLNEWDTLISDYRFMAAENVNPVKATNGTLISGKYKIGKDIAPGEYTISPINKNSEGRYYSIFDEGISNNTEFTEDTTVSVPEAGYIVFYNSVMVVE
ncbi:MAG: protein phosphatase 2C domain-containing protein [Bacillota bacterium]